MRKSIYIYAIALALPVIALFNACEPRALTEEDVFISEAQIAEITADGKIYDLNDFLDKFMTEEGSFASDTTPYRTRSNDSKIPDIYLYSVDTLPTNGPGIYIRGRITTDDYAGNFYKAMIIQQIVNGEQQNLRISVDLGSSHGMYQMGQEILIRCNGLAVGRYANQPQLCVPSYNNNIFAKHAEEKVGWAPGRIQGSVFRRITHMIGTPDQSKLKYDELTLADLYNIIEQSPAINLSSMDKVRKMDGRLIRLKNVHFSGEYNKYGDILKCNTNHPDSSEYANVFAPTTQNVGYPQSRVLKDASNNIIMCSNSEYAKFATYYLPGANKNGITDCENWVGSVSGILGWYLDNAGSFPGSSTDTKGENAKSYKYNWSVTPRGIPGIGIADIYMEKEVQPNEYEAWVPKEFDPNDYNK